MLRKSAFPLALGAALLVSPGITFAQEPPVRATPPERTEPEKKQEGEDGPRGRRGERDAEPRRGVPVDDPLLSSYCSGCHETDERGMMSRVSYMRKSPEGWSMTLKRMIRLYEVKVTPTEAREIVRYLSDRHGLTRAEAERSLYESERRVHWSEEHHDEDLRQACSQCHTLGRVLAQQRDEEEWKLLRSMHVAYFPLSRGQMGGGPPRTEGQRGRFRGAGGPGGSTGGGDGPTRRRSSSQDRGDRVLAALAKSQPLFTPDYESWTVNRREVPLEGVWTVSGHEVGHGDLQGRVVIRRVDEDEYATEWDYTTADGNVVRRQGKGILYAGYSWRGRCEQEGEQWREVLLLDEQWRSLRGRIFSGAYDEIGVDVRLHRHEGLPRVHAVGRRAVSVPATGHVLDVYGEAFPSLVRATDFHLGAGIEVTAAERVSDTHIRLTLDVAPGTQGGERLVAYGIHPGSATVVLYDSVDYIRISPLKGMARIGGGKHPKQYERFEAWTVNRGPDGKAYTDDDYDIETVPARWSIREFPVREDDDDVRFVGAIDPETGVFTPAIDGPNPERKWQANNVGDVYVEAVAELEVPVRPAENTGKAAEAVGQPGDGGTADGDDNGGHAGQDVEAPKTERRTFRARAHLLVTVPLYVRWNSLEWRDE